LRWILVGQHEEDMRAIREDRETVRGPPLTGFSPDP
jgi:hypothetical protein